MKSKINIFMLVCICSMSVLSTGCTSSSYGNSFTPIQTNKAVNQFTLKIYTGGFAGPEYAKKDLDVEAKRFMSLNKEYVDYKIISQKFELIPSGVTFIVEFIKES